MRFATLIAVVVIVLSACTPMEVVYWYGLHALPMPPDPVALSTKIEAPSGWINLGNGIWGPRVITRVGGCESGGGPNSPPNYTIRNQNVPPSSARGAYQFLTSTWVDSGYAYRYNAPVASAAFPWQQDEAAVDTWLKSGLAPWEASRQCWG